MKIKIETTIELKPHEVDAAHLWYLETAVEGESFRDWIKSMAASYCDYWVMSALDNYGHAVDNLLSNKPEEGKQYLLMGGSDKPSIANGNTWAASEIKAS